MPGLGSFAPPKLAVNIAAPLIHLYNKSLTLHILSQHHHVAGDVGGQGVSLTLSFKPELLQTPFPVPCRTGLPAAGFRVNALRIDIA